MHTTKTTVDKANKTVKNARGKTQMQPLTVIYWSRVLLGMGASLMCVSLNILTTEMGFFTGLSVAMLFYILTYYIVYKRFFITKVEKTTKIFMTGIGAYFITWIVAWTLFYTLWLWYTDQIPLPV